MNGGKIVVQRESAFSKNLSHTLIGNTGLYGATGGNLFVEGSAGERFAVRNSGVLMLLLKVQEIIVANI